MLRFILAVTRDIALATLVLISACGRDGGAALSTGPGITTVSVSTNSTTETSSASSTSDAEDSSAGSSDISSGTDDRFDMGVMPDFQPPPPGCKGKIDFLFLM